MQTMVRYKVLAEDPGPAHAIDASGTREGEPWRGDPAPGSHSFCDLGHADPGFTLRTYTHLMEGSAERTKRAIDSVFSASTPIPESVPTDQESP
jgi:hypothetical protein